MIEFKRDIASVKNQLKALKKNLKKLHEIAKKEEAGKLSIADVSGGELTVINNNGGF